MNKFKQAREVFDAIIENYEHMAECSVKDTLNNMPIDEGISAIKEALSIAERMVWQPIETAPLNQVVELSSTICHSTPTFGWARKFLGEENISWFEATWLYASTQDRENEITYLPKHTHPTHWRPIDLPETKGLEDE